ncbi:hypothetical protein BOTNAR_0429g00010 [Botryotinia narcissicola]|uniref:Uncharacterized protein n=1 Tax=Botryotinia narcissicola TaxID=278944 RepID=A0A4Z1HKB5_9HELO|nr:hypothetical protein BOTNAR_0429g00010 [Botryotinia narcissicola]
MVDITNRVEQAERLKSLDPLSREARYTEINDQARRLSELDSEVLSHRNDFLHPNLNVEDLTKVKVMLPLINSRGRNPPRFFVNADLRAADLGVYNLYLFLVNWCRALLQDIQIATIWMLPIKPEPLLLVKTSDNTTIASIAMETPYILPSKLDFNRLRAIVTAKRLSADDYIHDLMEIPGIFADAMMEASDHRFERLLNDDGKASSSMGTQEFCENVTRHVFHRVSELPGGIGTTHLVGRGSSESEDLMIRLFEIVFTPEKQTSQSLPAIMDEIEHIIEQDLELKANITPWVSRALSDLGLIIRLGHELALYLLWATGFPMDMEVHKDWLKNDLQDRCAELHKTDHYIASAFRSLKALGDPTDVRYNYPCDQRRTKKVTEAMQTAEVKLDYFWTKLDYEYRRVSHSTLKQSVGHIFTNIRTVEKIPDWIAPVRLAKVFPKSFQATTIPQFSINETTSSFVTPEEKIKPKIRGEPNPSANLVEDIPDARPSEPKERIYKLKARALKVFKVLFFQPSESNIPGVLPWTEFKYAMVATGFNVQKLHGSACQSTPPSTDEYEGKHRIQFHEPHSPGITANIPFYIARSMGRRLNCTYGWHGGMFVSE